MEIVHIDNKTNSTVNLHERAQYLSHICPLQTTTNHSIFLKKYKNIYTFSIGQMNTV